MFCLVLSIASFTNSKRKIIKMPTYNVRRSESSLLIYRNANLAEIYDFDKM